MTIQYWEMFRVWDVNKTAASSHLNIIQKEKVIIIVHLEYAVCISKMIKLIGIPEWSIKSFRLYPSMACLIFDKIIPE